MATNRDTSPIFTRVSKDNLKSVPVQDGRLILIKDTGEIWYDIGTKRRKVTSFIKEIDISIEGTVGERGKLYYNKADNSLYVWDDVYKKFQKVTNMSAAEVSYDSRNTTLSATNVQEALDEIKSLVDTKVDIVTAATGEDKKVISKATLSKVESNENGVGILHSTTEMSLRDGSTVTKGDAIYIKDLGIATEAQLAELSIDLSNKISAKLDTENVKSNVVTNIEFEPIDGDTSGFKYIVHCLDLKTGQIIDAVDGTMTANDMMLATAEEAAKMQAQINMLKKKSILMFALDFDAIFHTANPTKTDVDGYFAGLSVVPSVGTAIINTNDSQSTYNFVYTYYIDETVEPEVDPETGEKVYTLKLVPDGPDKVNIATADTIGGIKASANGDINVASDGTVTVKTKSITIDKLADAVTDIINGKVDKSIGEVVKQVDLKFEANETKGYPDLVVSARVYNCVTDEYNTVDSIVSLDVLGAYFDKKVDKVESAVTNNVVLFSDNGSIKDSGKTIDDIVDMSKVEGAVEGHIATFNSEGAVIDSGKSIEDITPKWIDWDEKIESGETV